MYFKDERGYNRNKGKGRPWDDNTCGYNCGSFALDVDRWFLPYITYEDDTDCRDDVYDEDTRNALMCAYCEDYDIEYALDEITELDARFIEQNCPWVERTCLEHIKPEDDIIAYRIGIEFDDDYDEIFDDDFHFQVRLNGLWFEKQGARSITCNGLNFTEEPWELDGVPLYNGPVVYFKILK